MQELQDKEGCMLENFRITEQDIEPLSLIDTCIEMYFEGDQQALSDAIERYGRDRVIALMFAQLKARHNGNKLIAATMLRRDSHYDESTF